MPRYLLLVLLSLLMACPNLQRRPGTDDDDNGDDDDSGLDDDDSAADDDDASQPDDDDVQSDDDDIQADDDDSTPEPSPCEAALRQTNVGCVFYAVDLDNAENFADSAAAELMAVAVANVSDTDAVIVVEQNNADYGFPQDLEIIDNAFVPAGDLHVFYLPRRDVDGDNITDGTDDGPQTWLSSRAFRITSDAPIVAYQFNPMNQAYSNDASLLLPQHALGFEHTVLGHFPNAPTDAFGAPANRAYVTVVGTEVATQVSVTPSYDVIAGPGVPDQGDGIGIRAGETAEFVLSPFDVLNLETPLVNLLEFPPIPDLTGTVVSSDKRVAVFFGTDLSLISSGYSESPCCAEHIEQQVLPNASMRNAFVVSHSAPRASQSPIEDDVYRVLAIVDGTTVTTNLPAPDDAFSLDAGEFYEFQANRGFVLESVGAVQVAQFLVAGGDVPGNTIGDSSMLYVPPVQQRRASYTFTTGVGFSSNYVVVNGPQGFAFTVDGTPHTGAGCVGPATDGELLGVTYETWTCPIDDGVHTVEDTSGNNVAVYVYGYYNAGSYAYPGGAGLD